MKTQKPFVDIFKHFEVFKSATKKGKVSELFSKQIGRRIFQIQGTISASNFVEITNPLKKHKNLYLFGRYVYIAFKAKKSQNYYIHLDYLLPDNTKQFVHLSNTYKTFEKNKRGIQIPFKPKNDKWNLVVLDMKSVFEQTDSYPRYGVKRNHDHELLKIKLCSEIKIKGIYTSDNRYGVSNLPNPIDYLIRSKEKWTDKYNYVVLPQENLKENKNSNLLSRNKLKREEKQDKNQNVEKKIEKVNFTVTQKLEKEFSEDQLIKEEKTSFVLDKFEKLKQPTYSPPRFSSKLSRVVGFTGQICPDIKFLKLQNKEYIISTSGKIIVLTEILEPFQQKHLFGHENPITSLDFNQKEQKILSCELDENPTAILWSYQSKSNKFLKKKFKICLNGVRSSSLSPDAKYVCFIGQTNKSKDCIAVYDVSGKKILLLSKHISEYNILDFKFSPIETLKFVSCGKENIKFWRIKKDHLTGCPVILNNYARQSVFTVIAFDMKSFSTDLISNNKVIVGSSKGMIFIVHYSRKTLESVYQVHEYAICSLSILGGFCVTGSQDQYIRVWPLDFSEFHLEAKHDGVIIGSDISQDGLQVAVGTSNGYLGVLDLNSQTCKTVMRSHFGEVYYLKLSPSKKRIISLSNDQSIRIWDTQNFNESYEFNYTEKDPCTCIQSLNEDLFIGGFKSGTLRIFQISTLKVLVEKVYHRSKIECIERTSDCKYLIVGDAGGVYSVINLENYELLNYLENDSNQNNKISCSVSKLSNQLALIGKNNASVLLYSLQNFQQVNQIRLTNSFCHTVKFNPYNNKELVILTTNSSFQVYLQQDDLSYKLLKEQISAHQLYITEFIFIGQQGNYCVTAGGDGKIRVWDLFTRSIKPQLILEKDSHFSEVYCMLYNDQLQTLYSAGGTDGIFVWDLDFELRERNTNMHKSLQEIQEEQDLEQNQIKRVEQKIISTTDLNKVEDMNMIEEQFFEDIYQVNNQKNLALMFSKDQHPFKNKEEDLKEKEEKKQLLIREAQQNIDILQQIEFQRDMEENYEFQIFKFEREFLKFKHDIPYNHFYITPSEQTIDSEKLNIRKKMILKRVNSIDCNSTNNYIWNIKSQQMIFFSENKIIFQSLTEKSLQKIIHLDQQISGIFLSPNYEFLFVGTFNSKNNLPAPLYRIELDTFTVQQVVNHNNGIQDIQFSNDTKCYLSAGSVGDNKVHLINIENNKIIFSQKMAKNINQGSIHYSKKFKFYTAFFTQRNYLEILQFSLNQKTRQQRLRLRIFEDQKGNDISCVKTLLVSGVVYIFLGTFRGQMFGYKYSPGLNLEQRNFKQVWEQQITSPNHQIVKIQCSNQEKQVVFSTTESKLYQLTITNSLFNHQQKSINLRVLNFPAIVNNIQLNKVMNEGVLHLSNGEIVFLNLKEFNTTIFDKYINKKNSIHQILILEQQHDLICLILDDGRVDFYQLSDFTFLQSLKCNSVISFGLYSDELNKLVLTSQDHKIIFVQLKEEIKIFAQFAIKQITDINKGFTNNYITGGRELRFGTSQKFIFRTQLGDLLYFQINQQLEENTLQLSKIILKGLEFRIGFVNYCVKGYLSLCSKKGDVAVFKNENFFSETEEDLNFSLLSKFTLKNKLKYDFNWIKTAFSSQSAFSSLLYCIANNYYNLIVYDFQQHQIISSVDLSSLPKSISIKKDKVYLGCANQKVIVVDPNNEYFQEEVNTHLVGDNDFLVTKSQKNEVLVSNGTGLVCYQLLNEQ